MSGEQYVYYLDPNSHQFLYLPKSDPRIKGGTPVQNGLGDGSVWASPDNDPAKAFLTHPSGKDKNAPGPGWYKADLYTTKGIGSVTVDHLPSWLQTMVNDASSRTPAGTDANGHAVFAPHTATGVDAVGTTPGTTPGNVLSVAHPNATGQQYLDAQGHLTAQGITDSSAVAGSDAAASGVNADGTSTTSNPYAAATASGTGVLDTLSSAKQQLEGVDVISGHGTHIEKSRSPDLGAPKPTNTDITSKAADLLNAVYSLSDKDLQNLQTKLQAAGYTTKPGDDLTATLGAYVSLIADVSSADANAKPGSQNFHVAVDDYLNRKAAANGVNPDGTTNGKSKTETSSSVNLTDPTTAQGLLQKALTDELGRQPTSQEVSDFTSALQSAESSNPTVKSVSGSSDTLLGQTTGDTSSTTSGGIGDLDAFAHNYVQNEHGPEAATDQIGNVYGLAMKALGLSGG